MKKHVLRNYNNGMLKKKQTQNAVLFEDLTFPQDSYEKDKKGRKQPAVQGKRVAYTSSFEEVSKTVLENLESGLEVASTKLPSACSSP